jgi:hypothetical protein
MSNEDYYSWLQEKVRFWHRRLGYLSNREIEAAKTLIRRERFYNLYMDEARRVLRGEKPDPDILHRYHVLKETDEAMKDSEQE